MKENNKLFIKEWIIILKFEEILNLLGYKDLLQLSLTSKSIYFKTKPLLLKVINISSPLLSKNLINSSLVRDDNLLLSSDMILKFEESVESIRCRINTIQIKQPPLFPERCINWEIFRNLETLKFYHYKTKIKLNSLNLILAKLQNLKELEFDNISVISDQRGVDNKLLVPSALTKLSIIQVDWPDYDDQNDQDSLGPYSILSTQKFPNLTSFEYILPDSWFNFNPINHILANSSKLESLYIEAYFLNQETFNLIRELKSLKAIYLTNFWGSDINLKEYTLLPSYSNITYLSYDFTVYNSETLPTTELLISYFSNLTNLSLSFEYESLPYLQIILNNLPNLNKLKLTNINNSRRKFNLKLNNSTVTRLILFNFLHNQLNFRDFITWKNLKAIGLFFDKYYIKQGINFSNNEGEFLKNIEFENYWKVFDYPNCIKFYKE